MATVNINNTLGHNHLTSPQSTPETSPISNVTSTQPLATAPAPAPVLSPATTTFAPATANNIRVNPVNSNHQAYSHQHQHHHNHHHHHHINNSNMINYEFISIKSKIGVEFRRYALRREDVQSFDNFYNKIEHFHQLGAISFVIFYTDSEDFFLPINNDDNLAKAISSAKHITLYNDKSLPIKRPFLKLFIEKKGIFLDYYNGKYKKNQHFKSLRPSIGMPEDFRQVSSIIDVDIVPETCRRVRIVKHGSDRPLGFYIRDGTYKRLNAQGQLEMVTGIFISRLVPGGLAESTGLLAVNDEVIEVNGIQVTHGKTLDQVTDMMVANSSNLIITIRPGKINNM